MDPYQKLIKARTALLLDHPFFGCLAYKMTLVKSISIERTATDGRSLIYNPVWIMEQSHAHITGVFAKAVLKAALGHPWRMGDRTNKLWQKASDLAVHYNLTQAGFTLPDCDAELNSRGDLSTEEIYADLKSQEQPPQQQDEPDNEPEEGEGSGGGTGQDEGDPGEASSEQEQDENEQHDSNPDIPETDDKSGEQVSEQDTKPAADQAPGASQDQQDGEGTESSCEVVPVTDEAEQQEQEAEWRGALIEAQSASQGNLPGDLQRIVDSVMAPDLPWHVLLRDFVEQTAKNDYNWSSPNKRWTSMGLHMPSMRSEELPEIVIAVDTSGSIDEQRLAEFASEASNVLEQYDTTARVIYSDNHITGEDIFERQDLPLKMNPVGGGGTDFRPVFNHIHKQGYSPACVIYFTDMYGTFPEQESEWPTLWVTEKSSPKAPWGQTVTF